MRAAPAAEAGDAMRSFGDGEMQMVSLTMTAPARSCSAILSLGLCRVSRRLRLARTANISRVMASSALETVCIARIGPKVSS